MKILSDRFKEALKQSMKMAAKILIFVFMLLVMCAFGWWVQTKNEAAGIAVAGIILYLSLTLGILLKRTWDW